MLGACPRLRAAAHSGSAHKGMGRQAPGRSLFSLEGAVGQGGTACMSKLNILLQAWAPCQGTNSCAAIHVVLQAEGAICRILGPMGFRCIPYLLGSPIQPLALERPSVCVPSCGLNWAAHALTARRVACP